MAERDTNDRLVVATVTGADAGRLLARLEAVALAPWLHSSVSLLSETGATILVAVPASRVDEVLALVKQTSGSRARMLPVGVGVPPFHLSQPVMIETELGGAHVLVLRAAAIVLAGRQ